MGLSPGYIHTDLIDTLHSMHIGNLNYGTMSMGLMYSHMALVPVDIACHGLELLAVIKMNKTLLIMVRVYFFPFMEIKNTTIFVCHMKF